jgi:hypothetical protein
MSMTRPKEHPLRIRRILAGLVGLVLIGGSLLGAAAVTTPPPSSFGDSTVTVDCSSLSVDYYTKASISMALQNLTPNTDYSVEVSTISSAAYDSTFAVTTDAQGAANIDTPVTGSFSASIRYIETVTDGITPVARQPVRASACDPGLTPVVSLDPTIDCTGRYMMEDNGYPWDYSSSSHLTGTVAGLVPSATYSLGGFSFTNSAVADASGVATFSIPHLGPWGGPGTPYNWTIYSHSQGFAMFTGTAFFSDHCTPLPPRKGWTHDYDVSGDGFADLLSIDKKGVMRYYPNNSHYNPGHVPFMTNVVVGSGWTPMLNVSAGDVDGNGYTDIVAATPDGTLKLYVNDFIHHPKSPFAASYIIGSGWTAKAIPKFTLADYNGDGFADIIAYRADGSAWFYQNRYRTNKVHPFSTGVRIGQTTGPIPVDLAAGDLNGDGIADLVDGPTPRVHPNLSPASNPEPFSYVRHPWSTSGSENPAAGFAVGDWEGRGYDSLISVSPDGSGNLVYIKDPMPPDGGTFYEPAVIGTGWQIIARIIP